MRHEVNWMVQVVEKLMASGLGLLVTELPKCGIFGNPLEYWLVRKPLGKTEQEANRRRKRRCFSWMVVYPLPLYYSTFLEGKTSRWLSFMRSVEPTITS